MTPIIRFMNKIVNKTNSSIPIKDTKIMKDKTRPINNLRKILHTGRKKAGYFKGVFSAS